MSKMKLHPDDFLMPIHSICILQDEIKEAKKDYIFWLECESILMQNGKYFEVAERTGLSFKEYQDKQLKKTRKAICMLKDGINQLKHNLN